MQPKKERTRGPRRGNEMRAARYPRARWSSERNESQAARPVAQDVSPLQGTHVMMPERTATAIIRAHKSVLTTIIQPVTSISA